MSSSWLIPGPDTPAQIALCNAVDRTFLSDRLPSYTEADDDCRQKRPQVVMKFTGHADYKSMKPLVESEKTAVICAGLMPQYLWLATGGKSQLKAEKFAVLGSRKITAFPDVDGFTEWTQKLKAIPNLNVTIADVLQRSATPEDFKAQIDIADWLLRERLRPRGSDGQRHSRTFLDIQKYISPEVASEVEALIDELGLEFYGKVEKVEVEDDRPP